MLHADDDIEVPFPLHALHDALLVGIMRQILIEKYHRRDPFGAKNSDQYLAVDFLQRHLMGAVGELAVALALGAPIGIANDKPIQWNALVSGANTPLPEIDITYNGRRIDVHATDHERGTDRQGFIKPDLILQSDDADDVEHVLVYIDKRGMPTIYGMMHETDTRTKRYFQRAADKGFHRPEAVTPPRSIPHTELRPFKAHLAGTAKRAADLDLNPLVLEHGPELQTPWDALFVAYRSAIRSVEMFPNNNVCGFSFHNGFNEGLCTHRKFSAAHIA